MARMRSGAALSAFLVCLLAVADAATAEVVRIDVQRRDDWGRSKRIIGRVHFAIDPMAPADRGIAGVRSRAAGTRQRQSRVLLGILLFFKPKEMLADARGTVFLEVVNRGRDPSLAHFEWRATSAISRESQWNLGDGFLLEAGIRGGVPWLAVRRASTARPHLHCANRRRSKELVRDAHIELAHPGGVGGFLTYCVAESEKTGATLTFGPRMDEAPQPIPRDGWQLAVDGCSMRVTSGRGTGVYRAVYSRQWFTGCRS